MQQLANQQAVLDILENLNGLQPLKELFWNELNYERINEPISRRGWNETASKALADDPVVFAGGGKNDDFKIVLARLDSDHVRLGLQRPVVNRLLRDFPYGLFVFSNRDRDAWHFVNVKYDDDPKRRQLFRRISVASGDRLRTASERMAMIDLQSIGDQASPLVIQDRHDEAFDVEKVTKKFFEDFSDIFEVVAKDIRKHNDWKDDIVEKETQTLLNRLLFLYFIQRKGWLNRERDYLVTRFDKQFRKDRDDFTYYSRLLFPLFMRLSTQMEEPASFLGDVPFLNGGLFDDEYGGQQRQDKLLRRTRMKVSNRAFARVFDDVLEKYNFTVREDTPLNQDVSIDPEMLGKIFESLVLQLEQSDTSGKTSRHDTGSYYTPRPIVHYLCRQALRVCLEGKGEERHRNIAKLLAIDASDGIDGDERAVLDESLSPEDAKALRDDLDNLRACDPAVGSGAFPLGLLHELVNLSRLCETRSLGRDPVEVDLDWLYDTKSKFIERVIYGVDIQERAVEICKLRLWLSLMVDLDIGVDVDDCSASAFRNALRRKVTPLPNLDYKVRRADSLIDRIHGQPVFLSKHQDTQLKVILSDLIGAKKQFYVAKKLDEKRKLRFRIVDLMARLGQHEIEWERKNLGGLIADEKHGSKLAELDRAMRELGHVRRMVKGVDKLRAGQQNQILEELSKWLDDEEKPTLVWQLDFAEVFHRESSQRTKRDHFLSEDEAQNGSSGFDIIVANPPYIDSETMSKAYPAERALIQSSYKMTKGNWDIYIAFFERSFGLLCDTGVLTFITPDKWISKPFGDELRRVTTVWLQSVLKAGRAVFSGSKVDAIVTLYAHWKSETIDVLDYKNEEIKFKRTVPKRKLKPPFAYDWLFSDYADLLEKIEQANTTLSKYGLAENACATSDAYKLKEFIQEAATRTIGEAFLRIINTGTIGKYRSRWGLREMTYLGDKYKRPVVKKSEFVRAFPNSYGRKSLKPKVIIKGLNLLDACLDPDGTTIPGKTTLIATASGQDDLKLLLAVLNSSIAFFYLKEKYPASSYNQGTTFTKEMLNSLPVPKLSDQQRKRVIQLVTKILANSDGSDGHTENDQLELNRLIATLYGLSEQELAVIGKALT